MKGREGEVYFCSSWPAQEGYTEEIKNIETGKGLDPNKYFLIYDNLDAFSQAVQKESGLTFDFGSVLALTTNFVETSEQYLILNIKEFNGTESNNLLFLNEDKAFGYLPKPPRFEGFKAYVDVLGKPFGKSTVLAYFILNKVLDSQKRELEAFIKTVRMLEETFDHQKYIKLAFDFEHFSDRVEEFHGLLLRLQETSVPQVVTRNYIAFDYSIIIAENVSLQARTRHRLNTLKELRQEHEMRNTEELNERIVKLNDVVRKLTALTVILMIPNLIASHFGMNFVFMPELRVEWAYPVVIGIQLVLMGAGAFIFRRIGWL